MDYVTAKIALGGDQMHIMCRGLDNPVSWPEVRILQHLHGDDCVFDCDFVRSEPSNVQMEKMRLVGVYGAEVVNLIYPGARPMIEMEFPGDKDPAGQKRPERRPVPSSDDRLEDEPPASVAGRPLQPQIIKRAPRAEV
jgi:hypothetical protein